MCLCVCVCVCVWQRWPNVAWEVMFAGLQISGRDLESLVGETTGRPNTGRDLVSCESANSKMMNSDSLIHIPGIQKWRQ